MPDDKTTRIKPVCATPKVAYRLMYGERLVGMALAFADGTWGLCDTDGRELSPLRLRSPHRVARVAENLGMGT